MYIYLYLTGLSSNPCTSRHLKCPVKSNRFSSQMFWRGWRRVPALPMGFGAGRDGRHAGLSRGQQGRSQPSWDSPPRIPACCISPKIQCSIPPASPLVGVSLLRLQAAPAAASQEDMPSLHCCCPRGPCPPSQGKLGTTECLPGDWGSPVALGIHSGVTPTF